MSSFKKVLSILLASSFLINYSFAQGEGNIWVIGYSPYPAVPCCVAILNFNADTVVIDKARNIVFFNPSNRASIADKDGKLLFYSDAQNIFNAAHKLMQNGDKININKPYNGMNSVLIVPAAQNPESYLIFSLPDPPSNGSSDSLYYSIVDMSKNDGLGAVIEKRVTLSNDIFFSVGIRAIKHGNGQDWWLLLHQFNSDSFVKFLITKDSMKGPFYQKIGLHTSVNTNFQNQMAFSKDGSLFARIFSLGEIEVYKFDRCTGELDIWKTWKQPNISPPPVDEFKGCSFSPNNRFFYASTLYKLFQYDLEADSPGVDSFLVDLADDLWSCCYKSLFNKHELGPNGKIYISSWGGAPFVHTIHDPDSLGNASNFEQRAIYIGDFYPPKPSHIDSYLVATLPNMPNYNLDPLPIYAASAGEDTMICVGDTALLGSPQVDKIIYQWSPSEGLSDQTIAQPFASPDKTTTYYLTIIDTTENRNYSCINRNVSVTVTVDENCSGLHEISSFYPNPSDRNGISMDYILKTDETGELVIYNILGIQTNAYSLEPGRHTLTISNSTWSTGMYIYKLFINGQLEEQGKLVVGK